MARKHWLFKTDPDTYSIADLERDGTTAWDGVRNYKARNFMRDEARPGDPILLYHSNADPTGVYGVAEVVSEPHPEDDPTWWCVDVRHVETFAAPVTRDELKAAHGLADLLVLKRGMRLSITPVTRREFEIVHRLGRSKAKAR